MTNVEKATKQVKQYQAELDRLTGMQSELSETLSSMEAERFRAVKALATGDEAQNNKLGDLHGKIAPLKTLLEGITGLISDAQGALETAQATLKEAKEEYSRRIHAFVRERELEEREALLRSLPERFERMFQAYVTFCMEFGDAHISMFMWQGTWHGENPLQTFLIELPGKLNERMFAPSLDAYHIAYPAGINLPVHPICERSEEIARRLTGNRQFPNIDEVAQSRRGELVSQWTEEFKKSKG